MVFFLISFFRFYSPFLSLAFFRNEQHYYIMSALTTEPTATIETKTGGTEVSSSNVNVGLLRCPRCETRIITKAATLVKRSGKDQTLWIPRPKKINKDEDGNQIDQGTNEEWTFEEATHEYWWSIPSTDDFDNIGMSRQVLGPSGPIKIVLCSGCHCGPLGHQTADSSTVWLPCSLLLQQDVSLGDEEVDFKPPENMAMSQIRAMMEANKLTKQFKVVFETARLGMMLCDAADGIGVSVIAFTEYEGLPGPAELQGDIKIGDKVVRVNGTSTEGFDYSKVLDLVINSVRPVTIMFERAPGEEVEVVEDEDSTRVQHVEWDGGNGKLK